MKRIISILCMLIGLACCSTLGYAQHGHHDSDSTHHSGSDDSTHHEAGDDSTHHGTGIDSTHHDDGSIDSSRHGHGSDSTDHHGIGEDSTGHHGAGDDSTGHHVGEDSTGHHGGNDDSTHHHGGLLDSTIHSHRLAHNEGGEDHGTEVRRHEDHSIRDSVDHRHGHLEDSTDRHSEQHREDTHLETRMPHIVVHPAYPNPVNNGAMPNVRFSTVQEATVTFTLYDASGRIVREWSKQEYTGEHETAIDMSSLKQGSYMLRVQSAGSSDLVRISVNP